MKTTGQKVRGLMATALIISLIFHVSGGIVAGLIYIILPPAEEVLFEAPDTVELKEVQKKVKVKLAQIKKQSAPPKHTIVTTVSELALPTIDVKMPTSTHGMGVGTGAGKGSGMGSGLSEIPVIMSHRCSESTRKKAMLNSGGNEACEEAVMKALRWLKKTQKVDGSWTSENQTAMTGFAILAFLGHCETPKSKEFGTTVTKAILYLIHTAQKEGNDGKIITSALSKNDWVYEHAIATYALAEAYTFCKALDIEIDHLDTVTKKAGKIIIKGQGRRGGWVYKYEPTSEGDNSVGYWQLQALKAYKLTKLGSVSAINRVSGKALRYLKSAQAKNGIIGYFKNPKKYPGLTGGGVLAFQIWGQANSHTVGLGIKYISENSAFNWNNENSNLYYHYYNAQAMINFGGEKWGKYNARFRDVLLDEQNDDGSWTHKHTNYSNLHMNTCLATLMLEVYYRFLSTAK